ncbi:hypothetical protein TNCV_2897371 [Trichonephila clavipes]|nr:hypothetical protein TNCV_2897371 [Trichonephila clavipes]
MVSLDKVKLCVSILNKDGVFRKGKGLRQHPKRERCSKTGKSYTGLLEMDHVILNHGQETWTTPELAPTSPNYHTTPTGERLIVT